MAEAETDEREIDPDEEDELSELDDETLERRRLALGEVRQFGDPVLKSKATEVTEFDAALEEEAARMIGLMQEALGIGLAATQLGVMRRLLVFQSGPDATTSAGTHWCTLPRPRSAGSWRKSGRIDGSDGYS